MIWLALFAIIVAAILFSKLITNGAFWKLIGLCLLAGMILPKVTQSDSGIFVFILIAVGVMIIAARTGRLNL